MHARIAPPSMRPQSLVSFGAGITWSAFKGLTLTPNSSGTFGFALSGSVKAGLLPYYGLAGTTRHFLAYEADGTPSAFAWTSTVPASVPLAGAYAVFLASGAPTTISGAALGVAYAFQAITVSTLALTLDYSAAGISPGTQELTVTIGSGEALTLSNGHGTPPGVTLAIPPDATLTTQ